jgi:membrane-bound lytic murein transglycosylase B
MFEISLTRRGAHKGLVAWLNLTAMHTLFRPFQTGITLFSFLLAVSLGAWGTAVAQAAERQALTSKQIKAKPKTKKKGPKVLVGKAFGNSAKVKALAAELAQQRGLPKAWVQQQIASARLLPQVQQMILPATSPAAKNWGAYRARFLEPQRIQAGLAFWQSHAEELSRAERTYGVPARYIVGILGVETYFGQHQGQFKVLDALATLSLAFPAEHRQAEERRQFFKSELGFHLQQRFKDPSLTNPLGSYAGASGWPQFMPSSIAKFAVDFDQDGHVNLGKSPADAIGSVAHYFQAYGWQSGMPTHFEVDVQASESDLNALLAPDIVPSWSATYLIDKKIGLSEQGRQFAGPLALVELNNGGEPSSFVAGTDNFFVVTRYNRSSYYALAVIELGEAIEKAIQH